MLVLADGKCLVYTRRRSLDYPERKLVMALEMSRTKHGRSTLIAREPVLNGSYAEVTTFRTTIRLTHPNGLIINNWPALGPDFETLRPPLVQAIEQCRSEKLRLEIEYHRRVTGCDPSEERVLSIRNLIYRPPICNGVSLGRPLLIKMPKRVNGEHDLGTIRQIIIYNQGHDPVTVR
jgi:hypothetical protein